jgi:hypothetical protein
MRMQFVRDDKIVKKGAQIMSAFFIDQNRK